MVNDAGGIKSLGGAKMNLILSDIQSDTDGNAHRNRSSDQRQQAVRDPRLLRERLTLDRERSRGTRQSSADHGLELGSAQQGPQVHIHAFARASQFAKAQLQMSKLVSDKPKVAVVFENTAFGTSTSNGLKEQAPGEGVEIVMFEPYSAGFTDAGPLINKVRASGANSCSPSRISTI